MSWHWRLPVDAHAVPETMKLSTAWDAHDMNGTTGTARISCCWFGAFPVSLLSSSSEMSEWKHYIGTGAQKKTSFPGIGGGDPAELSSPD